MRKAVLLALLIASPVLAQENETAYHAMRVVGTQFSRAALNRIVTVWGTDGNPQPARWHIVVADRNTASGLRDIEVENGQIVSNREGGGDVVRSSSEATINTAKLNLDSSGAYTVAAHTADTSHVIFDYTTYRLRTDHRGNPTWVVTLQSRARRPLGTIHIGANKGNITRVEGMYQGRNQEQLESDAGVEPSEPESQDPEEEDENIVKRRIKQMFKRTARDAAEMFHRVRRSFADFIDPDRRDSR